MSKKVLCILISLTMIFSVMLSGCGKASDTSKQSTSKTESQKSTETIESEKPQEKATVRILTRNSGDFPFAKAYVERIEQFKKENPYITVDDWSANDVDTATSKFKASIAAGDPPEIFVSYSGVQDKGYVKNGLVADLTPLLEADKAWADGFDAKYFDQWKFDDIKGIYAAPYDIFGIGIYYNKELFEKVGVEPPQTIEDLIGISEKFNKAGIAPIAIGGKDAWRFGHFFGALFAKKFGTQKAIDLNSIPQKAKWNDKDMVDFYTYYNDKIIKGGVFGNKINYSNGYNEEVSVFQTEKAAMRFDGSWYISQVSESTIADKVGYIPFPYFKDVPQFKDAWMGGAANGLCLSGKATGSTKDAAVKLLKYITGSEYGKYIWKYTNGTFASAAKDFTSPDVTPSPIMTAFLDFIAKGTSVSNEPAYLSTINSLGDVERNSLQGMAIGKLTAEQVGKVLQDEVDKNSK